MKQQKTENTDFEFKIKMKGKESLTIHDIDLKQSCWDCIFEIEALKPTSVEDWGDCDLLDDLLQNYFTWKLVYKENGLDITDNMADVEDFITKFLKQFHTAIYLDDLNRLPPVFQITD